jgi:DMSO/TMAO reductase YedYZ molybdopterin-dependent catalytic subunit
MTKKREVDLFDLYAEDPEKADRLVFGRISNPDRRGFLKGAGLTTMAAVLGGFIPFHEKMPGGLIPVAMAEGQFRIEGKDGLTVLNDRPVNAETPAHLLDDEVTPTARHFIRNNGVPPENVDPGAWMLTVDGEVSKPLTLSIDELRKNFEVVTLQLQLECGGNGRSFFEPKAKGNQWSVGAVACSEWTGVRLADVLKAAGIKDSAVYTAHYGADTHLSGDPKKIPISRGVPIAKAMDPHNLIAFAQNGEPIHPMNGAPLRLVIPGYPGSASHKWLNRIWVRDQVHDGPKMTGSSYRVPGYPVEPGEKVPKEAMEIIEAMPVKSLITYPQSGAQLPASDPRLSIRGHAWCGDAEISQVDVSIDFGATWTKADLRAPRNPFAWQHFTADLTFPMKGYYEVWARATDAQGRMQPFAIAWNPKGYLNNSMHRIAVRVA